MKRRKEAIDAEPDHTGSGFRKIKGEDSASTICSDDSVLHSAGRGHKQSRHECKEPPAVPSSILGVQFGAEDASGSIRCNPISKPARKWEDTDSANAIIVKELNDLSLKERERMFEEIHGVCEMVNETEEDIDNKLERMQKALHWITNKPAYNQAQLMSPSAVKDRVLLLKILRCENYNPSKAARRLVNYFEFRLEMFGIDRLVRPLRMCDLTDKMRALLEKGYYQIAPKKDRSGRSIVLFRKVDNSLDWFSFLGSIWYVQEKLSNDIETQKRGFICIIYEVHNSSLSPQYIQVLDKIGRFNASNTIRLAAYHFLHRNPLLDTGAHLRLGITARLRLRPHFGTFMECLYRLMSYGITPDMLPADTEGNMDMEYWRQCLEQFEREDREMEDTINDGKICPTSHDVLMGRGHPYQRFAGNLYMAEMIERNRDHYGNAPRQGKTAIAECIVRYITKHRGGRFLKFEVDELLEDGGAWAEVDPKDARAKISHGFRAPTRSDLLVGGESLIFSDEKNGETIYLPPIKDMKT